MEQLHIFGYHIGQYLNWNNLSVIIRFVVLLAIGLPLVFLLSKWVRRYSLKKFTSQQAMIFEKLILYTGKL